MTRNGSGGSGFGDAFERPAQEARGRMGTFAARAGRSPGEEHALLPAAFEELHCTLEELRVAEEELKAQNEELASARESLESERQRYRDLFEWAPDGYLVTDVNGAIREANRAAAALLGISRRFLSGKPLTSFIAERERRAFRSDLLWLAQHDGAREWEVRLCPRRGAPFFAALRVAIAHDRAGEPTELRWLVRDITERRRAHEERTQLVRERTARAEAEAAQQRLAFAARSLHAAYEREHRIAQTLQSSLLAPVAEDAFPDLAVATFYQPALDEARVGGDFYDAFALPGGEVALVVGDVFGKGLVAAARTAEVKYALRGFLWGCPDPAGVLSRLNDFVCHAWQLDEQGDDSYVVRALAVVHPGGRDVCFASAGGEPPLLLRAGGTAEPVEAAGTLLGFQPGAVYERVALPFAPGDTLVIATDGITEARRGGDFLDQQGLAELACQAAAASGTLAQMGEAIVRGACAFAGGTLHDDACLLLARRR